MVSILTVLFHLWLQPMSVSLLKNAYAIIYNHLEDVNNQNIVYILFTMLTLILISLSSTCMKNKYSFQMKCSVKSLIKSLLSAMKLFTF